MTTSAPGRRPPDLVAAAAAVLATAALAGGIPALLLALVGNPLPEHLPSGADFEAALTRGEISDATIFKAIACVAWLLWAQLLLTIGLEVTAGLKGRPAWRVPLGAPTRFVATRLAAAILLVTGTLGTRSTSAHAAGLRPDHPPAVAFATPTTPSAPAEEPSPPPPADGPIYVVERGDTLWSIAEVTLGDPLRWRDIEALNVGRPQPDGSTLAPGGRLQVSWQLILPTGASVSLPRAPTAPGSVTVEPGDTLWELAGEELGDPLRWPELYEHNKGPQPEGGVLSDPDLIMPGWQLDLPGAEPATPPAAETPLPPAPPQPDPPTPAPPPTPPSTPPITPTSVPNPNAPVPEAASPSDEPNSARDDADPPDGAQGENRLPLGVGGSALLALGIVATLRVLRHRQLKRRPPGRAVATAPPELAATEIAVRTAAEDAPGPWLDVALRSLIGQRHTRSGDRVPQPVAVEIAASELRVTLAEPHPHAPPPWTTSPPGWMWRLARSTPLEQLEHAASGACAPLPTLVTIGRSAEGPLLLDLEACGLVSVTGSPEAAQAFARSAALELAVSPVADALEVLAVADSDVVPQGAATPRVQVVESPEEALDAASEVALATTRALESEGLVNTFAARRASAGSDPWAPTVLILDSVPAEAETRQRVGGLMDPPGRGLGILVVGEWPDAPWVLRVSGGRLDVPRLGLCGLEPSFDAQAVEPKTTRAVVDLLDQTLQDSSESLVTETEPSQPDLPSKTEQAVEVEVRVLGEVEVIGTARALSDLETELVAFLATRQEPVEPDAAQTALWPQRAVSPKRWWNVVSETRKALGAATDGEFHLPPVPKGQRIALAPRVGTDLDRIRGRLRAAEHQASGDAIATLTDALKAVRGRPFTGRGYAWANADGLVAFAEAVVSDAAHLLASLCMETGDPGAALDATAAGLRAAPANEVLYRDRMRAHHQAGNISGVEAAMRDLCAALEVEDPCDELHPDTVALFEELTRHQPARLRARSG
ncbi:MAG: LysM peptidoglycan-binding domain-containing protein [Acidimicrobiia bacterium]